MEVKNLIEYMEIVCGKIMSYPLESNHTDIKYLSQMNSIGKEFILRTSSQSGIKTDKKIPEELCEYIDQYYNSIYSYYIKSKRPESSAEKDTHSVKFFFRGVNDVIYPLAPGIYRKNAQKLFVHLQIWKNWPTCSIMAVQRACWISPRIP